MFSSILFIDIVMKCLININELLTIPTLIILFTL